MRRVRALAVARYDPSRRRGMSRQRANRRAEVSVWRSAVRTTQWLGRRGVPEVGAARRIGLVPRTLRTWKCRWQEDRLVPKARGRPVEPSDRDVRYAILSLFDLLGDDVSEEQLRKMVPGDVPRAELRELKLRYRAVWRRGAAFYVSALRWLVPGSVWALDFTTPPLPIDGIFPRLLVGRDLPSASQLEVLPTEGEGEQVACDFVEALVARHGPPLVIKVDNGPAFRSEAFGRVLARHGILALRSPPYTPTYNGAAETGMGTLKTHMHYASARHDRPGEWTCDDAEEARLRGNACSRPHGRYSGTPDELWSDRIRIGDERRARFLAAYREEYRKEKERRGIPLIEPESSEKDSIDRIAIATALRRCGYLKIRRRRITPPIHPRKKARLS